MKISVIHPSYGRPELAATTAKNWLSRAKEKIEYILCLSSVDEMGPQYADKFQKLPVTIIYSHAANMVIQMNLAATKATGDLIIAVSDDFDCPQGWDELLNNSLQGKTDFVVRVDDGVRHSGINSAGIIPLPIMDRVFYNRVKCIYHPEYNHFYGDEELCRIGVITGKKIELPILFEHVHPVTGKVKSDHVNRKNNKFHAADKATFARREAQGFGLVKLSILIPTLKTRVNLVNNLVDELERQIIAIGAEKVVQLVLFTDNGERTTGEKRNLLVWNCSGDYVAFVDDDDKIAPSYVQLLLGAIQDKPDCCSLTGLLSVNGTKKNVFKHSVQYSGWYEKDKVLYRFPNHLNCIKKEIAEQVPFPESYHGEDRAYSTDLELSGLIKTEAEIKETLYFYNFQTNKSANLRKA